MAAAAPLWRRVASAIGRVADRMPAREKTSSERRAHLAAIDAIVERWQLGEISTAEKQQQIAAENQFWYGRERRSPTTGEVITKADGGGRRVNPPEKPPGDEAPEEHWWQK